MKCYFTSCRRKAKFKPSYRSKVTLCGSHAMERVMRDREDRRPSVSWVRVQESNENM